MAAKLAAASGEQAAPQTAADGHCARIRRSNTGEKCQIMSPWFSSNSRLPYAVMQQNSNSSVCRASLQAHMSGSLGTRFQGSQGEHGSAKDSTSAANQCGAEGRWRQVLGAMHHAVPTASQQARRISEACLDWLLSVLIGPGLHFTCSRQATEHRSNAGVAGAGPAPVGSLAANSGADASAVKRPSRPSGARLME